MAAPALGPPMPPPPTNGPAPHPPPQAPEEPAAAGTADAPPRPSTPPLLVRTCLTLNLYLKADAPPQPLIRTCFNLKLDLKAYGRRGRPHRRCWCALAGSGRGCLMVCSEFVLRGWPHVRTARCE